MYSMEESWDFENQESISPMQELKQKYAERLDEIEHHSPKQREFQLEQQKQKIRNWYEIKEHLIAITKEANELECQNVERRQELVIQLRRREQQLKQLKQTLKVKNKPKPPALLLKSPRSRSKKQSDIQEIDDLLAGFQAIRNYLQSKYGWQFSKQQVDITHTEDSYDDYDLLRSNKIKFDLLENKIYHLDQSAQQEYDVQRYQKRHKNGLLDQSVRSYQSLATSAKKEVLSLRFDKTSTRLPVISPPKEPVIQQSAQQVSTFRGILASTSKRLPYFSPSQMLQSPKIKSPQYGFMAEDIVANSVSSRILTRKQTTFNLSEGESQRRHRLKEQSVNMSQEKRIKHYYADANFDVIKEVPRKKKKEKRLERGEALKQIVAKVVQRSRTILHRLEGKEKKPSPEHSFNKIKEAQKKYLSEASTLSKANKLQLEERLGEISEVFFKVQKREQSKLFDYYKKQFKK